MKFVSPSLARGALTLAALFLVTACATKSGPVVRSDFDRAVNFSAFKTFGFPETTGTDRGGYTTLITSHFKEAVRTEMTARGYTYAESSPDLIVNFYSELKDKTRIYSHPGWSSRGMFGYGYGYPYGFGYPYGGYGRARYGYYSAWPFYYDDISVVQYTSGTIKLDVVDANRKQVVWEAMAEEQLTDQAQDNPQPQIARLITELFKKFPKSNAG